MSGRCCQMSFLYSKEGHLRLPYEKAREVEGYMQNIV